MKLNHIAISIRGIEKYALESNRHFKTFYRDELKRIKEIVKKQVELNIPVLTIYLVSTAAAKNEECFSKIIDGFVEFFQDIKAMPIIDKEKIKISILGKWYYLPNRAVDVLKSAIEETKEYDNFFLNFCINYNGQEEIVDACKLIARKIQNNKIDIEAINKELIKENIYSSYFPPPNLMVITGISKTIGNFLLWDLPLSKIHFTNKAWPEFDELEFEKVFKKFSK